ncbi:hypothetical protein CkaCkLH20_00164 [Colletotrichum karsti]|uniref:Uncharacterized protein n=1 Tax=Colletotrichum karsti TaxID=1095194 RepID=A0A9P6IEQ5_9PEZI|nr:uncharacterized protein CkaCkLH20_00164 [Colletotrichum karsti]KAF9882128.1 hypothetical protein CkaCkLH20_00164 [Colletotrichum karsti]
MTYKTIKGAVALTSQRGEKTSANPLHLMPPGASDENARVPPEKLTLALNSSNWRKPLVPRSDNIENTRIRQDRKQHHLGNDFDLADPATHWRKPVLGVDPLLNATNPVFEEKRSDMPEKIFERENEPAAKSRCMARTFTHLDPSIRGHESS